MPLQSPAALAGLGNPHLMVIQGEPGQGKTHLAGQAPGKVVIQSSDGRWDGVVQKLRPDDWAEHFLVANYFMRFDVTADELFREKSAKAEDEAEKQAKRITNEVWNPFLVDFNAAIRDPQVRTIVLDQADEIYEILRMANFGKLERNAQLGYGTINAEWKGLAQRCIEAKKNLIYIHQMADKYKTVVDETTGREKSQNTGERKRKGNGAVDYLVHSFVEAKYIEPKRDARGKVTAEGRFVTRILRAKLNPAVNGEELESPDWITLLSLLAPDAPPESWL